ncbi:MAG TPA: xanthine dehydrogenase family protein molybdopterin-binding subunit, partial [Dehalococcoidia bacterium]|nr:xanthine dehydrogenase family protein molybdopterin-binding subunit [Dehalococcoidia bacterium]
MMPDYEPNVVLSNQEFKVVGTSPIRHDGMDKVTGRALYGVDTDLPGMLVGKVLRSPHPHAKIKSIDTSKAEAMAGVFAVVTASDLPEVSRKVVDLAEGAIHNLGFMSTNILARDKVLYKGHAVAAVAANSLHLAEEALALITVDYEVLQPVVTAEQAMKDDAPLLHERLATLSNPLLRPGGLKDDEDTTKGSNISNHFEFNVGDIAEGFKQADVIVEKETRTAPV